MKWIICYDIADDRRRQRIAEALLDFGARIQESIFDCELDSVLLEKLHRRLAGGIENTEDKIVFLPLCAACESRVLALGAAHLQSDPEFYVL